MLNLAVKNHPSPFERALFAGDILSFLRLPSAFPHWELAEHDKRTDWIPLSASLSVDRLLAERSVEPYDGSKISLRFAEAIAVQLAELTVDGDTELAHPDDPLLDLLDGLKKRTTWPDHFELSESLELDVKIRAATFEFSVQLWIAVTDAVDVAREHA